MGRPPLDLGTHGKIRTYRESAGWRARTKYRDFDGVVRELQRVGGSEARAIQNLKLAIRDRAERQGTATFTPETKVALIAEDWYAKFAADPEKASNTKRAYRDRLDNQILPRIGQLRAREIRTAVCENFLVTVKDAHGANVAKMTKTVLSNLCGYAVRMNLMDYNPVRDTSDVGVARSTGAPQALSAAQLQQLRAYITYDALARKRDVVDLIEISAATGARAGELLAIREETVVFDSNGLTYVVIDGTVVREKGKPLEIQPPKSKSGYRTIALPDWGARIIKRRLADDRLIRGDLKLLFPSNRGTLRDPSNVEHQIKDAVTFAGMPHITNHWFRKTLLTLMHDAGKSPRSQSDQAGHSKVSFTQDTYIGRGVVVTEGADTLNAYDFDVTS